MDKLFVCPLCRKKKAWISSTYPSMVVHNCQGLLLEVGIIHTDIEDLKKGGFVKHSRFEPLKISPMVKRSFRIESISNIDDLKDCFQSLQLNDCAYFNSQAQYRNFPFWEKLWDFSCYKVMAEDNKLLFMLLFDSDLNLRKHPSCCMGFRGHKPELNVAKELVGMVKKIKNLQVRDEALALHYMTKELDP